MSNLFERNVTFSEGLVALLNKFLRSLFHIFVKQNIRFLTRTQFLSLEVESSQTTKSESDLSSLPSFPSAKSLVLMSRVLALNYVILFWVV